MRNIFVKNNRQDSAFLKPPLLTINPYFLILLNIAYTIFFLKHHRNLSNLFRVIQPIFMVKSKKDIRYIVSFRMFRSLKKTKSSKLNLFS